MPKDTDAQPLVLNPKHWKSNGCPGSRGRLQCLVCNDGIWRQPKHCPKHEKADKHIEALLQIEERNNDLNYTSDSILSRISILDSNSADGSSSSGSGQSGAVGFLGNALKLMKNSNRILIDYDYAEELYSDGLVDNDISSGMTTPPETLSKAYDFTGIVLEPSIHESIASRASSALADWLAKGPSVDTLSDSDEADDIPHSEPDTESDEYTPDLQLMRELSFPQSRLKLLENVADSSWYPWPNKKYFVLDIIRHLPRSVFSDRQNTLISWAMNTFGVSQIPAESSIKSLIESLQFLCGVNTTRYFGALGHIYYSNDLAALIAQEMANPLVRPFLHFFPEDSGSILSDAYQARRWLHDMDPELLTPVIKQDNQDYYIFEPTVLTDHSICMPIRWFKRSGEMYARAWRMLPATSNHLHGWVVTKYDCIEVSSSRLAASFPYFTKSYGQRGLPDPTIILGEVEEEAGQLQPWSKTDSTKGNRWRELSKGQPVYAFPIWLYCDDTSGNTSKRWNKHNSFLFVPAGLSHKHVHREYNVHFLSTSNLADPLEMAEAIVDQIIKGQKDGIWAWDCVTSQVVLLIPSVLALLGDNPMQSEFACHIGLNGKYFCRICYVCNPTVEITEEEVNPALINPTEASSANENTDDDGNNSANDGGTDQQMEVENPPAAKNTRKKNQKGKQKKKPVRKKKKEETLAQMVSRAHDFLTIAKLRHKNGTLSDLKRIYTLATSLGGMVKYKAIKTDNGVKDTYQEYYLEKSSNFIRALDGVVEEKQRKLEEFVKTLPSNPMNPLFRMQGIDAHAHTPVEILHVVLLGFVKYFWRDAMSRIDKKAKPLLITRLTSLDTTGLGISPVAGKNLVQWSGSLVGRDFRVVVQVAPFVLYDLLPSHCYDAWIALCALIPLVWQPVIFDLEVYLDKLQRAIDRFLNLTAKLTPRWFNKPKFHILLHLPRHIRLFGPAILFATETFESYNAVIRDLSVHSNRQAPSRDIGRGFANMNRLRHLTSGGKFHMDDLESLKSLKGKSPSNGLKASRKDSDVHNPGYFRSAGSDVKMFIDENPLVRKLLGFLEHEEASLSNLRRDDARTRKWSETKASTHFDSSSEEIERLKDYKYDGFKSCNLQNGDKCALDSWVIARNSSTSSLFVGQVVEILQVSKSASDFHKHPDLLLLSVQSTDVPSTVYQMLKVISAGNYALVEFTNVMCSAHVLHNCADNGCSISGFRAQKQERSDVDQLIPVVSHVNPTDRVLNCCKMRDYRWTQEFCLEIPITNRDDCIHHGAVQEFNARRRKKASQAAENSNPESTQDAQTETRRGNMARNAINNSLGSSSSSGALHGAILNDSPAFPATSPLFGPGPSAVANGRRAFQRQTAVRSANPLDRVRGQF